MSKELRTVLAGRRKSTGRLFDIDRDYLYLKENIFPNNDCEVVKCYIIPVEDVKQEIDKNNDIYDRAYERVSKRVNEYQVDNEKFIGEDFTTSYDERGCGFYKYIGHGEYKEITYKELKDKLNDI